MKQKLWKMVRPVVTSSSISMESMACTIKWMNYLSHMEYINNVHLSISRITFFSHKNSKQS